MKRIYALVLAVFGLLVFDFNAAQAAPKAAGEAIPSPFVLLDKDGETVGFDDVKDRKGVILLFVRSADWCPYCVNQLKDWGNHYDEWRAKGYEVISVSYDAPEVLRKAQKKHELTLPLYSDPNATLIRAFGILNDDYDPSDKGYYGIPKPAVYVVGADGVITHRFAEKSFRKRPKISEVNDALAQ